MQEVPSPYGISSGATVVTHTPVGALSQAWYDALGLARYKTPSVPLSKQGTNTASVQHRQVPQAPQDHEDGFALRERTLRLGLEIRQRSMGMPRRIVATETIKALHKRKVVVLRPTPVVQRSAGRITIRARQGAIRMLVQRDADRMKITAICDRAMVSNVQDALAQARVRLAGRGVNVEMNVHGEYRS